MLKAVEASRARAIDTVIRRLEETAGVSPPPTSSPRKKKRPLTEPDGPEETDRNTPAGLAEELESSDEISPGANDMEISGDDVGTTGDEPVALSLKDAVEKIPDSTRRLLEEFLRGEFCEVRRFQPHDAVTK